MEYVNLYLTDLLYALSWLLNTNTISEITFFFLKKIPILYEITQIMFLFNNLSSL